MAKKEHKQLAKQALQKPSVKKAYDEMGEEFKLLDEMLTARNVDPTDKCISDFIPALR
jgi:hypothetical protein